MGKQATVLSPISGVVAAVNFQATKEPRKVKDEPYNDGWLMVLDPVAMKEAKHHFGDMVLYCDDQYEALIDADGLMILTEWPEFKFPNFKIVRKLLNHPVIFDGRNIYDKDQMSDNGFDYFCIGLRTTTKKYGASNRDKVLTENN